MKTSLSRIGLVLGITCATVLRPALASTPTGHIMIADETIKKLLADPKTDPALRAILQDPAGRYAFRGGACAPDLDTISEAAHCDDPRATAEKLMNAARSNLDKASARLANATTLEERAQAETDLASARADLAFAYGWHCHAAADQETHPFVNSSLDIYWEESTPAMKAWHGEWETMQEESWGEQYGRPSDPTVDYRQNLLNQTFGLTPEQYAHDTKVLDRKTWAADAVGTKYDDEQRDFWNPINQGIGERSLTRAVKMVNNPGGMDNGCWDIGPGINQIDFIQFEEETERNNGGKLPDGFWVNYEDTFARWQRNRNANAGGTSSGGGGGITLPPPAPPASSGAGPGSRQGSGQPFRPMDRY